MIGVGAVLGRVLPGLGAADLSALVPAEVAGALRAWLDVARSADRLGPPVPLWLRPLFEAEGARAGVPADLLAALAFALSGWRPEGATPTAHGLCGVPGSVADGLPGPAGPLAATAAQLSTGDKGAWDALRGNVRAAAAELVRLRDESDGDLAAAVARYAALALAGSEPTAVDVDRLAATIVGAWLVFASRRVPADVLAGIGDVLGGRP